MINGVHKTNLRKIEQKENKKNLQIIKKCKNKVYISSVKDRVVKYTPLKKCPYVVPFVEIGSFPLLLADLKSLSF